MNDIMWSAQMPQDIIMTFIPVASTGLTYQPLIVLLW